MNGKCWVMEFKARLVAQQLSSEADQALSVGNRDRCIEVIGKLYDVMDAKERAAIPSVAIN